MYLVLQVAVQTRVPPGTLKNNLCYRKFQLSHSRVKPGSIQHPRPLKHMNQDHYMVSRDPSKALKELVHVFERLRGCTDPGSARKHELALIMLKFELFV